MRQPYWAIHEFFRQRAQTCREPLRELLRVGRISLSICLTVLAGAIWTILKAGRIGEILGASHTIRGWVSMWRRLEIFSYDRWRFAMKVSSGTGFAALPDRIRCMKRHLQTPGRLIGQ